MLVSTCLKQPRDNQKKKMRTTKAKSVEDRKAIKLNQIVIKGKKHIMIFHLMMDWLLTRVKNKVRLLRLNGATKIKSILMIDAIFADKTLLIQTEPELNAQSTNFIKNAPRGFIRDKPVLSVKKILNKCELYF